MSEDLKVYMEVIDRESSVSPYKINLPGREEHV